MKALLPLLASCIFCLVARSQAPMQPAEIVFRSVNVIPMDEERVLNNQVVVVKNGIITAIGSPAATKYSNNALVIDGKGRYLLPGLSEMHAHVPPVDDMEPIRDVALLFLLKGVTTIRGMLGHPNHLILRDKIKSGEITGPHLFTSGPSFNGQTVKNPAEAVARVKSQKEAGYDFLKLHPGLSLESFDAIARTAREVNIPFAGHVSYAVGIWHAIDAGYASIDHLDGFIEGLVPGIESIPEQSRGLFGMFVASKADTTRIPKLITALKEKQVWVVPTQALAERWFSPVNTVDALEAAPEMVYMDAATVANWKTTKTGLLKNPAYDSASMMRFIQFRRKLIYQCYKSGVGMLLGSDAPQVFNVPGFSTHHELQYMVDAGLSPYEALRMATVNPATYFKETGKGTLTPGSAAEMILLNANPLENISNTMKIEGVMIGNKWLPASYIEKELDRLKKRR